MGIKDLLRFMKPYTEPIHIRNYAGKRVGIDAYSWLHKGAYSCSMELSLNSAGDKKFQYINYFMHRINLLKYHEITPVVVFDGGNIPCKAGTEDDRYRKRKANKEMAMEKLKEGNVNAATELFQRAISITPSMVHQLIQTLRLQNVEFLVAPYEADAQLAYLSSLGEEEGGIVAVISEDSDLLAYGCPAVIFKMDRFGNGEEIVLDKVFKSTIPKPSFRTFDRSLFIGMCVLAGCDFLQSVPGIGICKAHSLVSKYRNIDRALSVLKLDKNKQMPEDYLTSFREAIAVFEHARIYDRDAKMVRHMTPISPELLEALGGETDFLGPEVPSKIAAAIAEGKLDPVTMESYDSSPSQHCLAASQTYTSHKTREGLATSVSSLQVEKDDENQTESCFTLYSTKTEKEEKISKTGTPKVQRRVLKERNFSEEAIALAKLASTPSKARKVEENCIIVDEGPLKTPDNNPFRKRKVSENTETTTPVSTVTDIEPSELRCPILDSQESVNSKVKKMNSPKIKDNSTIIPDVKNVKVVKKSKTSSCKSTESSKSSSSTILNFFNRI